MVPTNNPNTKTDALSEFLQAIRSSSILSERQREKLEATVAAAELPIELAGLVAGLIKNGILTKYQARQILKGRPEVLIFGNYVILDFLGKGTMGRVYTARHRMMGRVVALKVLDGRCINKPVALARFRREMHLVGRLDHDNVVRAFDADRIGLCYFIAMEYVEGGTLGDLVKARGPLPPAAVVNYAAQTADGLAHAHACGIVHRDIKPSNLLLTRGKKIKILDFGLGTLLEKNELVPALTSAGYTVGTPDYISPEQARMVKIDGRSDLFSLGCTMYYLTSGQVPFKGGSSMDCLVRRITDRAVPINQIVPGLPARLVQIIEKLMATNPDDRYQTAAEAAAWLRSVLRPKNAAPRAEAPAAAAVPAEPATVPGEETAPPAPPVTVAAEARVSKPTWRSRRSRMIGLLTNRRSVLAAAAVAVAVPLIFVAMIILFRPSPHGALPLPEDNLPTNAGTVLPAGGVDNGKSRSANEKPSQRAADNKQFGR